MKKYKIWTSVIAIILIIAGYTVWKSETTQTAQTFVLAKIGTITEEVSVTGNVKPFSDVDLAFERGGKIAGIAVSVGDRVYQGQYLAAVANGDLVAAVNQAKAAQKIAEAGLATLQKGARTEDIAVVESQVESASSTLLQAEKTLVDSINDAYVKADDSVRNKIDPMFINPRSPVVQLKFQTDFQLKNDLEQARPLVETSLVAWAGSLNGLTINSDLVLAADQAKNNLITISNMLENLALAVNNLTTNSSLTQTTIDTWKLNVSTARTNISLAISSLSGSSNQYKSSLSALQIAQNQLALKNAPATAEQIASQEAVVEQAKAGVASAEAQLAKSIINSPINGVVTSVDMKLGEIVPANKSVVSVISYGEYQIDSYIPEADIAKVKIGDKAKTTLDAYGSDVTFETAVIKIDPAATVIDGVPTYKVTLKFTVQDARVKSGMTANLDIMTNTKENVLIVPTRAIMSENNKKYVNILGVGDDATTTKTEVVTGLRGVDGFVEIISGLKEGDRVVTSNVL
ncbi:MAG: efflux RND transporter periplasmic adaptor subunit [bacterium]